MEIKPSIETTTGSPICVVMAYNENYKKLGEYTSSVNQDYCRFRGYNFRLYTEGFDESRPASWSKLLFVKDALKNYEFVFWIDTDAVFTNKSLSIERFIQKGGNIFVGREPYKFHFGIFLIRNSEWSFWLLDKIWSIYPHDLGGWEQAVFNELVTTNQVGNNMIYFPLKSFMSVVAPGLWDMEFKWQEGDFIGHCWGKHSQEKKLEEIKKCIII